MAKQLRVNAFVANRPVHQSPGLWRHPRDRSTTYKTLQYWTDLARVLEGGLFNSVFLADGIGANYTYGGSLDAGLRRGSQVPSNDPFSVISAMAAVTQHLGLAVTGNISLEPPYMFARRVSTLDHLTQGRFAWNIVTGKANSLARITGKTTGTSHDERYDFASDYMEIVYKLWEGSWEDGAILMDRREGIVADPAKVHIIQHDSPEFKINAVHLCEPSPQRTPVLFQAGSSNRGRDFAATHAEGVFISPPSKKVAKQVVRDTRERAAKFGRDPSRVLFFPLMTVIVDETEEKARKKFEEYKQYVDLEGARVLFSGWTGIDFSTHDLDAPFKHQATDNGVQTMIDGFSIEDRNKTWTLREIIHHLGIGGQGPLIVGSPAQVADQLQSWADDTDVDGFNLAYAVMPETFADFGALVVPELQKRGVFKHEYGAGTLREKLFSYGPHLPETHVGSTYRPRTGANCPDSGHSVGRHG